MLFKHNFPKAINLRQFLISNHFKHSFSSSSFFFLLFLKAGSSSPQSIHEIRRPCSVLHHFPVLAGAQCLRSLWWSQKSAQWNDNWSPAAGLQGQNHQVLLDGDANYEMGSWLVSCRDLVQNLFTFVEANQWCLGLVVQEWSGRSVKRFGRTGCVNTSCNFGTF